jgi:hypothetical protein
MTTEMAVPSAFRRNNIFATMILPQFRRASGQKKANCDVPSVSAADS